MQDIHRSVRRLGRTLCRLGESPLWSVSEQCLYWVDIEGRRLHRHAWRTQIAQSWPVPERIGCIVLDTNGGLIAAMESGLYRLAPRADGRLETRLLHAVSLHAHGMRFNDGRCDRQGRLWVTSMPLAPNPERAEGALWRFDRRGLAKIVDGLIVGNGLAFSPDGRILYLADTHASVCQVWTFDLDAAGALSNRRTFIDMTQHSGRPDGAAVDGEGAYWICGNDGGMVHRFLPDGRLDRSFPLPVERPTMCSFGGPQLEHLFITSMQPKAGAHGPQSDLDGATFVCRTGVRGIAETPLRCAGSPAA